MRFRYKLAAFLALSGWGLMTAYTGLNPADPTTTKGVVLAVFVIPWAIVYGGSVVLSAMAGVFRSSVGARSSDSSGR